MYNYKIVDAWFMPSFRADNNLSLPGSAIITSGWHSRGSWFGLFTEGQTSLELKRNKCMVIQGSVQLSCGCLDCIIKMIVGITLWC